MTEDETLKNVIALKAYVDVDRVLTAVSRIGLDVIEK